MSSYPEIYAIVKKIPRGKVSSYGRIAKMVGTSARQVGYAMASAPPNQGIPWQRVINSSGQVSPRSGGDGDSRQRQKLAEEGVVFDPNGRVDFARFGWQPHRPTATTHAATHPAHEPPRIVIATGEPAGIGPDITLQLAAAGSDSIVAVGDLELLRTRAAQLHLPLELVPHSHQDPRPGELAVIHRPCNARVTPGKLNPKNRDYVLECLNHAVDLCLNREFGGLVTAPVSKAVLNRPNAPFYGHTEYIAARTHSQPVVMMLANQKMRVCLLTTHIPLSEVAQQVTQKRVKAAIEVILCNLKRLFGIKKPRLGVCGLNPHAGESGHLGDEEIEAIAPAIQELRAHGANLTGPLPADTIFTAQYQDSFDAILAMYHDQGLPVIKRDGFGETVNITLGLPIVRTSPDHGVALDLAASGEARADSLRAALKMAQQLAATTANAATAPQN